jgi:hypothetical protein
MQREEYLCRLTGTLTKFTQDQGELSPGVETAPGINTEFSIVLGDSVALEAKALVYEIQIHILLGMTHEGRCAVAKKICQRTLDLYSEVEYPLRRVRVIERLLYLAVVEGDPMEVMDLGASAVTLLASGKVCKLSIVSDSRPLERTTD